MTAWSRRLRSFGWTLRGSASQALRDFRGYKLNEINVPFEQNLEFDVSDRTPRINLVLLGIQSRNMFGGGATALRFLGAIEPSFERCRIIVTGEREDDFESDAWPDWTLESRGTTASRVIAFPSSAKFVVRPGDRFVATHWRTAYFLSALRKIQSEHGGFGRTISAYLIQDFEPGFYPWGSSYVLADSTYRPKEPTVAVYNTGLLKEYFDDNGYQFVNSFVFEPSLNPALEACLKQIQPGPKKKLLLVYGRPKSSRNAFELIVEALKIWARKFEQASQWRVVSVGAPHRDIQLASNVALRSKGKVTLEEYGSYLADAAVGISLMVSPHPSYPPLEMAEYSVNVVTNSFANKDLAKRSSYIHTVFDVTPENLAEPLVRLCDAFDRSKPQKSSVGTGAFLGGRDEFPFIGDLAAMLKLERLPE